MLSTLKTYAWIIATADSKTPSKTKESIKGKIIIRLDWGVWDLNSVSSKCPATMLAASRTDRVKGRIKFLINSINTMKGIKIKGVPSGTKCANILFGVFSQAYTICPSQRGRAKEIVNVKCLDAVKI